MHSYITLLIYLNYNLKYLLDLMGSSKIVLVLS